MPRYLIKGLLTLALGALLFGLGSLPARAGAPEPRVDGNQVRDAATGERFVPRGVNWPSFEYACVQGWGYSNHGADAATAGAMAEWGVNTVRIPLNQDCWLGDDDQPAATTPGVTLTAAGYRAALEAFITDLNAAGIVVILDLHWSGPPGTVADGLRPMADSRSTAFWASVAGQFRENRSVIFDLFNEPHSRWFDLGSEGHLLAFDLTWSCWARSGCRAPDQPDTDPEPNDETYATVGMKDLVAAVRGAGATQPLILSGIDYANDLRRWASNRPDDSQLIAGFHNYPGQRCGAADCWQKEIVALAVSLPVITTEVGQNDCRADFLEHYMNWADRKGIGYLAWAWWALPVEGCSNFALIDDLDGTPSYPLGTTLRDHLQRVRADPPPEPDLTPPRPPRQRAALKFVNVRIRDDTLRARIRLHPLASGRLATRVDLSRGRKVRRIRKTIRVYRGQANLKRRLPTGWIPRRLFVRYPGDAQILPGQNTKRLKGPR